MAYGILVFAAFVAATLLSSPDGSHHAAAATLPSDREAAQFPRCSGPVRVSCVVDGDTFWYRGAKIRIADINAPEVSTPHCAAEARLGARATTRLAELLNAGAFTLEPADRPHDSYGRSCSPSPAPAPAWVPGSKPKGSPSTGAATAATGAHRAETPC
jgi:endonuclease YncB( thermonuclease family)